MRSNMRSDRWWLMVVPFLLFGSLATQGAELQGTEQAKKQGKTGSRLVGVSCICQPPRLSQAEMEKWIDMAALDKPDIILLTEGCMQNTPRSASRNEADAKAEPLPQPGPITEFLSRKAKQYHTYIIACYWRKNLKGPGRFNSAVLLDREGKLVGYYDKMFPTVSEMESGVLPGRGAVIFNTDFGRIGALICFDLNFDELVAEYKKQGAELLCFLTNFRGGERVPAVAWNNHCFIASAVPGENGVIIDPLGRTLAESSQYGPIIFARINLDSRVVHIDFNVNRVRRMKEKYGPAVRIETVSPEAYYYLTSLHPDISIDEMIDEFEVERLDKYLDRSRSVRLQCLPKE